MNGREFWALHDLSDDKLEASLNGLLGAGARLEARIVAHLAEVDARRLHLTVGCSSLYDYCRKRLGLSDYEAFARIAAARAGRKYPLVFAMLERRQLHLTAVCEVREFLTAENHRELLNEVAGKTKLQIREVLAARFPQADVPTSLKKLPALEPLSPGRYRLQLMLTTDQKHKLDEARDLMSHANPTGDLATVLERALDELISRLEKRRFGRTDHPTAKLRSPHTHTASHDQNETTAMAHGRATSEETSQRRATSSDTANEETSGDETTHEEAAREKATSAETSSAETSSRETSSRETSSRETSSREVTGAEISSAETSSAEISSRETSSAETSSRETSSRETTGKKATSREISSGEISSGEISSEPVERRHAVNERRRRKHITHETRRQLVERDGCDCSFVGTGGERCGARAFLQFHHRRAWARGGPDNAENLQVLCRAHNRLRAEQDFGRAKIERTIAGRATASKRSNG